MNIPQPYFIALEGIDGAGKTTIQKNLSNFLTEYGYNVLCLKEPTESIYGKKIRELLQQKDMPDLDIITDLFIQDRKFDTENNIIPALKRNEIIIIDRYYFSNAAYQGAMGADPKKIISMNIEAEFIIPDTVFFIDIPPELSLERINKRTDVEKEVFEKKEFLTEVRKIFLEVGSDIYKIIDGTKSPEDVVDEIISVLKKIKK